MRDRDPVHHVDDGDYWVLSRHADVFAAARDTETFSSAKGLTFLYGDVERLGIDTARPMVMMDPPDHTAFRRLVARGFTPRQVASIEPAVRSFVTRAARATCRPRDPVTWCARLFKPLPSMVVAHYLGVPEVDRARFDGWTDAIVAANASGDPLAAADAVGELFGYFATLIEMRRAEPGDDTISQLVRTDPDADPTDLAQVIGFAFTMVTGGNDTTTGLLGGAAQLLTERPDQRALLIAQPELIGPAVEEFLRLTAPVQGLARTTTRAVERRRRDDPGGPQGDVAVRLGQSRSACVRSGRRRARGRPRSGADVVVQLWRTSLSRCRGGTSAGSGRARGAARA